MKPMVAIMANLPCLISEDRSFLNSISVMPSQYPNGSQKPRGACAPSWLFATKALGFIAAAAATEASSTTKRAFPSKYSTTFALPPVMPFCTFATKALGFIAAAAAAEASSTTKRAFPSKYSTTFALPPVMPFCTFATAEASSTTKRALPSMYSTTFAFRTMRSARLPTFTEAAMVTSAAAPNAVAAAWPAAGPRGKAAGDNWLPSECPGSCAAPSLRRAKGAGAKAAAPIEQEASTVRRAIAAQ
mmetsp:Transcript_141919/g.453740  ORF Transcript_141919/g.453740 Transcript_141919/m.453740 type:complete len:245 (+) Transcript_141919:705-1439(+)